MARINQTAQDSSLPDSLDFYPLTVTIHQVVGDAGLLGYHDVKNGPVLVELVDGLWVKHSGNFAKV
jgi:hypothetical protein